MNRIEKIAQKVYRQHENAVYMLINDLEELFDFAIDNNLLITDANKVYDFLGITDYISDPTNTYTVDTEWDLTTGNITVFKDNKSVTLKIGI